MKRLLTITAIVAIGALTACNPLEPITPANRVVQLDVNEGGVQNPTNAEGGACTAEPCDPPPNDTPNEDEGGLPAGECDTPGEGGCPTPETSPPTTPTTTSPPCGEGGGEGGGC